MTNQSIKAFTDGTDRAPVAFGVNKIPDFCPICHSNIEPIWRYAWLEWDKAGAFYQCPRAECRRLFFSHYERTGDPRSDLFLFRGSSPWRPEQRQFANEIKTISPSFCSIYDEAYEAEQRGLTQICGPGYRKALEFMIKDYLINELDLDEMLVRIKDLGKCVEEHISDHRIKQCAKRAAWLGNDEAHYYRKWEDKDIRDLKSLIELTGNWIQSDCLTKKFMSDMPKGK